MPLIGIVPVLKLTLIALRPSLKLFSWGTSAFLPKGLGPPAEKTQQECANANH